MSDEKSQLISILSGHGFDVLSYPVTTQGFYLHNDRIEHWSNPCTYNEIMKSHFSNELGLIQDGFQSLIGMDDLDHLVSTLSNWKKYLIQYGVIQ